VASIPPAQGSRARSGYDRFARRSTGRFVPRRVRETNPFGLLVLGETFAVRLRMALGVPHEIDLAKAVDIVGAPPAATSISVAEVDWKQPAGAQAEERS